MSLLEPDNELYNGGIVDKSHRYEKMYVIRPQFFVPLITLLVSTSRKSLDIRKQLFEAQQQSIDITHFEEDIEEFKDKFGRNFRLASEKFQKAIEEIDNSIKQRQDGGADHSQAHLQEPDDAGEVQGAQSAARTGTAVRGLDFQTRHI